MFWGIINIKIVKYWLVILKIRDIIKGVYSCKGQKYWCRGYFMLDRTFSIKLRKTIVFAIIFTILFAMFFTTLRYTLPFVLGFIIALSTRSVNNFLQEKMKISSGFSSIITTTIVFLIVGLLITLAVSKITTEVILLLSKIPSIDKLTIYIDIIVKKIMEIIGQIDPVVLTKIYEYLQIVMTGLLNFTIVLLNTVLSAALKLPNVLLIMVITFIASYLFSKDLKILSKSFYSMFTSEGKAKMRTIVEVSTLCLPQKERLK